MLVLECDMCMLCVECGGSTCCGLWIVCACVFVCVCVFAVCNSAYVLCTISVGVVCCVSVVSTLTCCHSQFGSQLI